MKYIKTLNELDKTLKDYLKDLDNYEINDIETQDIPFLKEKWMKAELKVNNIICSKILYKMKYNGNIYIDVIQSYVKGFGYGFKLMLFLNDKYGHNKIKEGVLTKDGKKLRQKINKLYKDETYK